MKFCPKCEKLLRKKKIGTDFILECIQCGHQEPYSAETISKSKKSEEAEKKRLERKLAATKTMVLDDTQKGPVNPTTKVPCPKCGHPEAEFFQYQTRSADEPATTFYKCMKCQHQWREY